MPTFFLGKDIENIRARLANLASTGTGTLNEGQQIGLSEVEFAHLHAALVQALVECKGAMAEVQRRKDQRDVFNASLPPPKRAAYSGVAEMLKGRYLRKEIDESTYQAGLRAAGL